MSSNEPALWVAELRECISAIEHAREVADALGAWAWHNVAADDCLPHAPSEDLSRLLDELQDRLAAARSAAAESFQRLAVRPSNLLLAGMRVSEEQYFLLRAMGVVPPITAKQLGFSTVDDFELCQMLSYEDEKQWCYICLDPKPDGGDAMHKVGRLFGRYPEDLRPEALRPDQREFLAQHLPELLFRFGRDVRRGHDG